MSPLFDGSIISIATCFITMILIHPIISLTIFSRGLSSYAFLHFYLVIFSLFFIYILLFFWTFTIQVTIFFCYAPLLFFILIIFYFIEFSINLTFSLPLSSAIATFVMFHFLFMHSCLTQFAFYLIGYYTSYFFTHTLHTFIGTTVYFYYV